MRYFIHIRLGQKLYEDYDGREFSCLTAARDEVVNAVRVLLTYNELFALPDEQSFDIQDATGETVMTVPFNQAFGPH